MGEMIRVATQTPDDLVAIRNLLKYGVANGKVLPRTQDELDRLIAEGHLYVAESDGRVVGMAALEVYSPRLAEVRSVVVLPDYQRQGIGSVLVEQCLAEAKRLGVGEILAVTDRLEFFHKLGFRRCLDDQEPLFIKLRAE